MRNRPEVSQEIQDVAVATILRKMKMRLKQRGTGSFMSSHEILGIITEEYYELIDEVKNNCSDGIKEELMDIAVAAIFGLASAMNEQMDWM